MEVSTEISQKIRSAIKAKLMELGAYVDDELPDYIMVMVANKKSRSQMSSDLCLFLGTNTEAFTGWLHGLLGKLQTITVESSDKIKAKVPKDGKKKDKKDGKDKKKARTRKHSSDSSKKKSECSEKSETSQIESKQLASSEITTEINAKKDISLKSKLAMPTESSSSPRGRMDSDSVEKDINFQEDVEDVRQLLVTGAQADELAEELETTEEEVKKTLSENSKLAKPVGGAGTKEKGIDNVNLKVRRSPTPDKPSREVSATNRKRKVPISVVASVSRRSDNDEEEYDPYNPAVGSVASVVKVTSRKSSVPASLQANRTTEFKNSDVDEPPEKLLKVSEPVSLDELKQVLEDVIKKCQDSNDEIALFSKMVETALRKLKTQHLHLAKLKIQEVLFQLDNHDHETSPKEVVKCSEDHHEVTCVPRGKETAEDSIKLANNDKTLAKINSELIPISTTDSSSQIKSVKNDPSYQREKQEGDSKPAKVRTHEPNVLHTQSVHVNNQLKISQDSEKGLVEDVILQSPVSSSKLDSGSPCSFHSCPPSSTSGSDSLALRRCIVSTSTQSPLSSRNSKLFEPRPPTAGMPNKSIPSIIVDSIHKRSRTDSTEPVLKQIGNRPKGLQGVTPSECEEEPPRINPEALKVLAKNLKVTVVNKRATQQSSSEDSSSDDSDEDESSEDENVNNLDSKADETKAESRVDLNHELNKEVGN